MKREIMMHKPKVCGCCPGHDLYPAETYKSRLSKKARSRDKKKEHQHVRTIVKEKIRRELILNED
mgnify:CR=1 FL=1|jgi:hypothetical protein